MKLNNWKTDILIVLILAIAVVTAAAYRITRIESSQALAGDKIESNYMDRHLLSDNLIYIFGPEAKTIVAENIFAIGAPLGGNCDFYKMTYNAKQEVHDPLSRCPAGARDINTPLFVKPNAVREAAIRKTCRLLTENPQTLAHALALAGVSPQSEVTPQALEALHFAFYRAPSAKSEAAARLPASDNIIGWAARVNEICTSPGWQVL